MRILFSTLALAATLALSPPAAQAFEINFDWKGLKLCTSGSPNRVNNPRFVLRDVPAGTKYISFRLTDRNAPSYNHGGGVVKYTGQRVINPGAFKYQSPCPPSGRHTYEWRATAQTRKNGGRIEVTRAVRKYPE